MKTPFDERKCVKDEYHFVLECFIYIRSYVINILLKY